MSAKLLQALLVLGLGVGSNKAVMPHKQHLSVEALAMAHGDIEV